LQVLVEEDAEQADQEHALSRAEVAPVDARGEHAQPEPRSAVRAPGPVGQPAAQPGLDDDHDAGQSDQHRDDGGERLLGQVQQQQPAN
jgi:hypothetical protein